MDDLDWDEMLSLPWMMVEWDEMLSLPGMMVEWDEMLSLPGMMVEWDEMLPLLAHRVPMVDGKVLGVSLLSQHDLVDCYWLN